MRLRLIALLLILAQAPVAPADPVDVDLSHLPPPSRQPIPMGTATSPAGESITVDGTSLLLDGHPWLPAMGEFHYSRYPQSQWRDELLKMKAGGIDIVSTYVFWIHHEEIENQWDWTGRRDLRRFVQTAGEVGLKVVLRIGPWDHGEVRNGGFPDWLLHKGYKLRSNDPGYLAEVSKLYQQIGQQVSGLLWKQGGPIIGVQVENEYSGRAAHLLTLKQMAITAGLDVPFYDRTGWPRMATPVPFGQLLPLYGGYAEGFWDRQLTPMPGSYWKEFIFQAVRTDTTVATDQLGARKAEDEAGAQSYPYLTCELGGGMMPSYHRRILNFPMDQLSLALVRLGAGSNLLGYYMYHGGENPDSLTGITLNEQQNTAYTNYNDLPVKTYDFQAGLGEFGQVRPQYHLLRRLHLFLHDFGPQLANMQPVLRPQPTKKTDAATLRYAIRSDGHAGFIFVNNYQRMMPMPAKPAVQWQLKLTDGHTLAVPAEPMTVPADRAFVLPFNLDLGSGATLVYATAQPICTVDDGDTRCHVFAAIPGIDPEFSLQGAKLQLPASRFPQLSPGMPAQLENLPFRLRPGSGGTTAVATFTTADGKKQKILLLSDEQSLQLYKMQLAGPPRLLLTPAAVIADGDTLRLQAERPEDLTVAILPADDLAAAGSATADGEFRRFQLTDADSVTAPPQVKQLQPAGPLRKIPIGKAKVAEEPTDADFQQAAVWQIALPGNRNPHRHWLLRVHYIGDVARAYAGDRLLTDNFYNGTPFDIGLDSVAPDTPITLKILPLQKNAPIYLLDSVKPSFATADSVVKLDQVQLIEQHEAALPLRRQ